MRWIGIAERGATGWTAADAGRWLVWCVAGMRELGAREPVLSLSESRSVEGGGGGTRCEEEEEEGSPRRRLGL